jgi:hypothetical protein
MRQNYQRQDLLPISREKLVELLPKLKEHKFESKLLNAINSEIEFENQFGYENELSDSEVLAELNSMKSHLTKATASLERLAKNKWAARRCDYFYNKANDDDMLMFQLSSSNFNEVSAPKSGYSNTLVKMTNGLDSYIEHVQPSKGRDKNLNYVHVIISILKFFELDEFPYKVSQANESRLIKLTDYLLKQDSRNLVKNAINDQDSLRESV